eukprot:CFRG0954T1
MTINRRGSKTVKWQGRAITKLSLHRKREPYQRIDLVILFVLFATALRWCYNTAGDPYRAAIHSINEMEAAEIEGVNTVVLEDSDEEWNNLNLNDLANVDMQEEPDLLKIVEEVNGEIESDELPSELQPDFWALFYLAVVCTLTALWSLGQAWSIRFKALIMCTGGCTLSDATIVCCTPRIHRGKAAIVDLEDPHSKRPYFIFQKQRYEWSDEFGLFEKISPPVRNPVSFYTRAKPYRSRREVDSAQRHYGINKFEIPMPTFADMYKEQITSPFFCFQIFCVLLWCLEDYWQYSLFNLCMILFFEASVVLTRRISIGKLRGMGNKASSCDVWRYDGWMTLNTEALLPGDKIRLTGGAGDEAIIPCDCLLIEGSAVVNESTLTGESVPLLKERVEEGDGDECDRALDIKGVDKVHVLFGGTKLMEAKHNDSKGVICYVLRTGFSSSQGRLVRRIEFSTEKVSSSSKDAALLLMFLLIFALISSGYFLKRSLEDGERSRYDILLHCILIITSVVPPDLPMQMAFSINTSVSTLMGQQVFCTEPFRIPMAGKITACCFDKTGTITTDKLHAAGVVIPPKEKRTKANSNTKQGSLKVLSPMVDASYHACLVTGGCHSLVVAGGQILGDPMETAVLESLGWRYSSDENVARPFQGTKDKNGVEVKTPTDCPRDTTIKVLHRHHFQSRLQRMSVVAQVSGAKESAGPTTYVLCKGSPEMIQTLLDPENRRELGEWYTATHRGLAKQGYRVIALASKKVANPKQKLTITKNRVEAECNLLFAGFVAFNCRNRADSVRIITELKQSNHRVIMITGDAILTAAHVGTETNILRTDKNAVLMLTEEGEGEHKGNLVWQRFSDDSVVAQFKADEIPSLAQDHDLCVTGSALMLAGEGTTGGIWKYLHFIYVYARMKPDHKEKVLMCMKSYGLYTLMCGDGTNDVGALKAADVGVALLSGFGEANVSKDAVAAGAVESAKHDEVGMMPLDAIGLAPGATSSTALTPQQEAWAADPMVSEVVRKARKKMLGQRDEVKRRVEEKKRQGEWFAEVKVRVEMAQEQQLQMAKDKAEAGKKPGEIKSTAKGPSSADTSSATTASVKKEPKSPWDMLENQDMGETEMVKLGDASIAAPFTSKMPSIQSTVDIIRQGRCTLLSTIQMYQILALNCLISSYSLSALYLDGVKYGDRQMTLMGILSTICYLCISRGTPLPKLSPVHPPESIFHPALFLSLIGQFVIHLSTMMYNTALAKSTLPEDYTPDVEGKFSPNVINTVVFLTSCTLNVSVFMTNYKGRPFMTSIFENSVFMICLFLFGFATVLLATETLPFLNEFMGLATLPSTEIRVSILYALAFDFIGSFSLDRLVTLIFMPEIWKHSTITVDDLKRGLKLMAWAFGIMYLCVPTSEEQLLAMELAMNETEIVQ